MKIAYFDCFGGAAGDMTVASMLDAGVKLSELCELLSRLGIDNEFDTSSQKVTRCGLAGTLFDVADHNQTGHHNCKTHSHGSDTDHGHDHGHSHEHGHDGDHSHSDSQTHDHSHDHDHGHAHSHAGHDAHGHCHGEVAPHDHSSDHDHHHGHGDAHSHTQDHGHGGHHDHHDDSDHEHAHAHQHGHTHHHHDEDGDAGHSHGHSHEHAHGHGHTHEHGHEHDHDHSHGHDHTHDHGHSHSHGRNLDDILALLDVAKYPPRADNRIRQIFRRLAAAEASAHGVDISEVHFHEVGAVDSIVDIVSSVLALELLDIDEVYCSPIPLGCGTVRCAHGIIPVPAPATAALMLDGAIAASDVKMELCTPTGAAIMTTLAKQFTTLPQMDISAIGYGAGTRDTEGRPNMMRVFIGTTGGDKTGDSVVELQANIDDCSGELVAAALEKLIENGAFDAWVTPIIMKKSRPAMQLSALCSSSDVERIQDIFFSETTTIGVRRVLCQRSCLSRSSVNVATDFGDIRVKLSLAADGGVITARPEFDDCRRAAETHHRSVREVMDAAAAAWRQAHANENDQEG